MRHHGLLFIAIPKVFVPMRINKSLLVNSVAAITLLAPISASAGPELGNVVTGSAAITNSLNKTDIHQSTNKAIINWKSFNIDSSEHTQFHQPSSSSITLNRIQDTKASEINGRLTANGHIMLINPNGVVFGAGSRVDVGSLTATTADIDNDDFMAGKMNFNKAGSANGSIINNGGITAKQAGLVTLVAPHVENNGTISAKLAKIELAAADTFTIDMAGDGLIQIAVTNEDLKKIVYNSGRIEAEGGIIALRATEARKIVDSLVENVGLIQAQSMSSSEGVIILGSGETGLTVNNGVIDASGRNNITQGGRIEILGQHIALGNNAILDASGTADFSVPSSRPDTSTINADKTIKTEQVFLADYARGGGSIKIGGDYLGSGDTPHAQTLYVDENSQIYNDAIGRGDGGRTILWSDHTTDFNGNVFSRGGVEGGHGGFLETSGKLNLNANGSADLTPLNAGYSKGTYLLDPANVTIVGGAGSVHNNAGLVGYWGFNENAGGTTADLSASSNAGTFAGNSTWSANTPDTFVDNGSSLLLDGSGDYVNMGNGTFGNYANYSATAWVNLTLTGGEGAQGIIVSDDGGNDGGYFAGGYSLYIKKSTGGIGRYDSVDSFVYSSVNKITANTWNLVGIRAFIDPATGYIDINLNGGAWERIKTGDTSYMTAGNGVTDNTTNIGRWSGGSNYSQGNIDNVRVYDNQLSQNDMAELYGSRLTVAGLEKLSATSNLVIQASNSIDLDLQGDTLNLAADRNITLQTTNGNITDTSAGAIQAVYNTTGGNISLIAGGAGSIDLDSTSLEALGGGKVSLSAGGNIDLTQTGSLNLGAVAAQNINIQTTASTSDIALNSTLTSTAAGNSINIATKRNFINNTGAGALNPGPGRWLIYSTTPDADTQGGLSNTFKLYNNTYTGYSPASVIENGNGFLYSVAPILNISADSKSKIYGEANPALTYSYNSGLIGGDTLLSVLNGAPATSAGLNSAPGNYAISLGSLAASLGYQINFTPDALTVKQNILSELNHSVQQQIQLPRLLDSSRYTELVSIHGKSDDRLASDTNSESASEFLIGPIGTDTQTYSNERNADVRLLKHNLLSLDKPTVDFYDLCNYNSNYCN